MASLNSRSMLGESRQTRGESHPCDVLRDIESHSVAKRANARAEAGLLLLAHFREVPGIGMGDNWPAVATLAMESWPVRSRGFMGAVMQGSSGIGFLRSSAIYGLFYNYIGWRGLLMIGILPALLIS